MTPFRSPQWDIAPEHIDAAITALTALRRDPRMDSLAYVAALKALDRIIGNDVLAEQITDWSDYHGLTPSECLACGRDCRGECDLRYELARDGDGIWL